MPRLPAPREDGVTPVLATLFLVGSAIVLAVGFYAATEVAAANRAQAPPAIGWWEGGGPGRMMVVSVDQDARWSDLQVATDVPSRVALHRPGPDAPMAGPQGVVLQQGPDVNGGDALWVCAVGGPAQVQVRVTHAPSQSLVLQRTVDAPGCPT